MDRWQDVQSTLAEWRAAERRASRSQPFTPERIAAERDVAEWRAAYQAAVGGTDREAAAARSESSTPVAEREAREPVLG